MKHLMSLKSLAAVAVALGAFTAASSAHARSDVYVSIGVQVPGVYVQPTHGYAQPRSYLAPAHGYYQRFDDGRRHHGQHFQRRGHGGGNIYHSGGPRNQWSQSRAYGPYGDLDRDGVMNRRDRDRDGDGVRNRNDRRPDNPYRR
jgi:hypothetical protein